MNLIYQDFVIRPWQPADRQAVAQVIGKVLAEYGLGWEPELADRDVLEIEKYYLKSGGEFGQLNSKVRLWAVLVIIRSPKAQAKLSSAETELWKFVKCIYCQPAGVRVWDGFCWEH